MKKNIGVRNVIDNSKIRYWQIAKKMRISESAFSKMLRHKLSKEKKKSILKIIENLKKGAKKYGE